MDINEVYIQRRKAWNKCEELRSAFIYKLSLVEKNKIQYAKHLQFMASYLGIPISDMSKVINGDGVNVYCDYNTSNYRTIKKPDVQNFIGKYKERGKK